MVGERRCPIVDTWWQTETGGTMITPLPGATALKPGSRPRRASAAVARLREALLLGPDNAHGTCGLSVAGTGLATVTAECCDAGMAEQALDYLHLALAVTPGSRRCWQRRDSCQAELERPGGRTGVGDHDATAAFLAGPLAAPGNLLPSPATPGFGGRVTTIPFKRALNFSYGRATEAAPGIRRVVARNPGPFTLYGTGTYIVGRGNVAVIDPGPADPAHIRAILRATRGETITHMLVTHTHNDHSPGCRLLAEHTDAPTYGFGPHGAGKIAAGVQVEEGGDMDFTPGVTAQAGEVIEGDGWTVECVYTPGHTSNHLCFALRESRALFSGDHVMGWSTSVISPPDGDMASYMASLDLLLERDDAVYFPTHGPSIEDPKPHVRAFIAHRKQREAQILECLAQGIARIRDMVPMLYAGVALELHGAAARSLFAAMALLVERGDAACDGELALDREFRLVR